MYEPVIYSLHNRHTNITHCKSLFRLSLLPFYRPLCRWLGVFHDSCVYASSFSVSSHHVFVLDLVSFCGRWFYFLSFKLFVSTLHAVFVHCRFLIFRMVFSSESLLCGLVAVVGSYDMDMKYTATPRLQLGAERIHTHALRRQMHIRCVLRLDEQNV